LVFRPLAILIATFALGAAAVAAAVVLLAFPDVSLPWLMVVGLLAQLAIAGVGLALFSFERPFSRWLNVQWPARATRRAPRLVHRRLARRIAVWRPLVILVGALGLASSTAAASVVLLASPGTTVLMLTVFAIEALCSLGLILLAAWGPAARRLRRNPH